MLGALVRGAGYFVLGMLVASFLAEIVSHLTPLMRYPDGSTPEYVAWLDAVSTQFPFIVLFAILFGMVARASVEAQVGGAR